MQDRAKILDIDQYTNHNSVFVNRGIYHLMLHVWQAQHDHMLAGNPLTEQDLTVLANTASNMRQSISNLVNGSARLRSLNPATKMLEHLSEWALQMEYIRQHEADGGPLQTVHYLREAVGDISNLTINDCFIAGYHILTDLNMYLNEVKRIILA